MHKIVIGLMVSTFFSTYITPDISSFFRNAKDKITQTASDAKKYTGLGINFVKSATGTGKILSMIKGIDFTQSRWQPLPDNMPLSKAMFVGSHNSFSTLPVFKIYNQHVLSIRQQLDYGVRGLMPDTYLYQGSVQLCHGSCTGAPAVFQAGSRNPPYQKFTDLLREIYVWLMENPQEIVFLFLENYVPSTETDASIEAVSPLLPLIVTVQDWTKYGLDQGQDITLGQLRHDNKRIMIFNSEPDTKWTMRQWDRVSENNFSTIDPARLCGQRGSSEAHKAAQRPLLLMNYFKEVTETISESIKLHTYENMLNQINLCLPQFENKVPNFIFIDRLESLGIIHKQNTLDLFDLVNTINKNTIGEIYTHMAEEEIEDDLDLARENAAKIQGIIKFKEMDPAQLKEIAPLLQESAPEPAQEPVIPVNPIPLIPVKNLPAQ